MGANNWATCPQCKKNAETGKQKAQIAAGKAYGNVAVDRYLKMLEATEKPIKLGQTFREDYEIGIDGDGVFSVDYSGSCDVCGLKHIHKAQEEMRLK